jgi:hypothetical protein
MLTEAYNVHVGLHTGTVTKPYIFGCISRYNLFNIQYNWEKFTKM